MEKVQFWRRQKIMSTVEKYTGRNDLIMKVRTTEGMASFESICRCEPRARGHKRIDCPERRTKGQTTIESIVVGGI